MNVNRISTASCVAFALASACTLAFSQVGGPPGMQRPSSGSKIVPGSESGWGASKQSAEELAAKTDQAMSWLKGFGLRTEVDYKDANIGGRSSGMTEIETKNRFHYEYPVAVPSKLPKGVPTTIFTKMNAIADGKQMCYLSASFGRKLVGPVATAQLPDSGRLSDWPRDFPKLLVSAFRGGKPFGKLIASARAAGNMTITVGERQFDFQGRIMHQRRIVILKKVKADITFGVEIMIDVSQYLPLKIAAVVERSKTDRIESIWSGSWGRPRSGKFDPKEFQIPGATKPLAGKN
jgi:hypothetical protein